MKKIVFVFIVLVSIATTAFAQIPENLNIQEIVEEETTDNGFPYTMTIEYIAATGEAFFTFSINMDLFEKSEAMIGIRDRILDFIQETKDETGERKYYDYGYYGADKTKYDAVNNLTHYTSRVRFSDVKEAVIVN